ncbi:hypothetical protein ACI2JA_19770 [Alkalihalobacillus sp. NPDC078783]|uniref:hypothetical protein n=1 Tax=Streptomyces albidoflavus TaxID=1886 RepID=UPI0033F3EA64
MRDQFDEELNEFRERIGYNKDKISQEDRANAFEFLVGWFSSSRESYTSEEIEEIFKKALRGF